MTRSMTIRLAWVPLLLMICGCPVRGGSSNRDDDDNDDASDDDDVGDDDDTGSGGCDGAASSFSESEPNDSEGAANTVTHNDGDVTISGSVGACSGGEGEDDFFEIQLGCSDSAQVRLSWSGSGTDLDLYAWDLSSGDVLVEVFSESTTSPEEASATLSGGVGIQVDCWESGGTTWTLSIDFATEVGDDDDTGDDDDDDDDDTGDDDDATGTPCNPSAAELACQNAGPSLGSGAYTSQSFAATPVDCGNDLWSPGIDLRSVPSTAVGVYVGWHATGSGQQLLASVVGPGTTWVDGTTTTNLFGGTPTQIPVDPTVVGAVFPQSQATFPLPGCLGVYPATGSATGQAGEFLYTVRTDNSPDGYFQVNVANVVNSGLTESQLNDAMMVAADLLYYEPDVELDLSWEHYTISDSTYTSIPTDGAETNALRATALGSDDRSLNLFVVGSFDSPNTLGFAGGIPGPLGFQGLGSSGVILAAAPALDGGFNATQFGQTIAHELGHQLGWFHTSEADGTAWDPMSDTPQCPASNDSDGNGQVGPDECPDGENVMFWQAAGNGSQTNVSPEQADVLIFSPILR